MRAAPSCLCAEESAPKGLNLSFALMMREKLEFWLVLAVARPLGWLPRGLARCVAGACWPGACIVLHGRLRRVGVRNLELALAGTQIGSGAQGAFSAAYTAPWGWQLVEFCRMPATPLRTPADWLRTEGLEHYLAAEARGKGVLIVTGHMGAWELSSFYHSLMGHPMGMVAQAR
jgi:KDO2-lipid IV(A) lauroyltransferase